MRKPLSALLSFVLVSLVVLITGCGGEDTAAPEGGPVSFAKIIGTSNGDIVSDVTVTPGGLRVVTGLFAGTLFVGSQKDSLVSSSNMIADIFAVALREDGSIAWKRGIGGEGTEWSSAIAADNSGNLFLGGTYREQTIIAGSTLPAVGLDEALIVKLDASGNPVWAVGNGSNSFDVVSDVFPADGGDVFVCGRAGGAFSLAGQPVGNGVKQTGFTARLSSLGGGVWGASAIAANLSDCSSLAKASDGSVWVTGTYSGSAQIAGQTLSDDGGWDGFIANYSASGTGQSAYRVGGTGTPQLNAIVMMGSGFAIAGSIAGTNDFDVSTSAGSVTSAGGADIVVARYSAPGAFMWVKQFGSAGDELVGQMCRYGSDHLLITGLFSGSVTFGSHTITSNGQQDVFLVELNSSGDVVRADAIGSATDDYPGGVAASGESAFVVGRCEGDVLFPGGTLRHGFGGVDGFIYQR